MTPLDALVQGVILGTCVCVIVGLAMIDLRLRQIARALGQPAGEVVGADPAPLDDDGWVSPPPEAETVRAVSPTPNRAWPFANPSGPASPPPAPPPPATYLPGQDEDRASGALGR